MSNVLEYLRATFTKDCHQSEDVREMVGLHMLAVYEILIPEGDQSEYHVIGGSFKDCFECLYF
jgi:hypothetical protein